MLFRFVGVALSVALTVPFLINRHTLPLTSFHGEWAAALAWLLVAGLVLYGMQPPRWSVAASQNRRHASPLIWQLPLAAVLVVLAGGGTPQSLDSTSLWTACLLAAGALLVAAGRRCTGHGLDRTVHVMAWALLSAATIGTFIEWLQFTGSDQILSGWVSRVLDVPGRRLHGNLNQANHQATLIALGLAAAVYLSGRSNSLVMLSAWQLLPMWLGSGLVLTGSRTALLQVLAITAFALLLARNSGPQHRRLRFVLALLPLLWVMAGQSLTFGGPTQNPLGAPVGVALGRSHQGDNGRLLLWQQAWQMFVEHPWTGIGLGEFSWQQLLLARDQHRTILIASHAHNLVLDLLAKTGLVGTVFVMWAGLSWVWRVLRAMPLPQAAWLPAIWVVLLTIHSLFEFPLHYTYFWLPFCFWLGQLDPGRPGARLVSPTVFKTVLFIALLVAMLLLWQARIDHRRLERMYEADTLTRYEQDPPRWLFRDYAAFGYTSLLELDKTDVSRKLILHEQALKLNALPLLIGRTALLKAFDGDEHGALALLATLSRIQGNDPRSEIYSLAMACARLPRHEQPRMFCEVLEAWGRGEPPDVR